MRVDLRVQEALRMGFKVVVVPEGSSEGLDKFKHALIPCRTLLAALESALDISSTDIVLGKKKSSPRTRRKANNFPNISGHELRRSSDEIDEMLHPENDALDSYE